VGSNPTLSATDGRNASCPDCLPSPTRRILWPVPFFMDRHDFTGLTAIDAANMHLKDLELQGQFGVEFVHYWFDYDRQTAFCLAKAPSADAIEGVHRISHGAVPGQVVEADESEVARYMGGVVPRRPGEAYVDSALRTIGFTDIEGSTRLTQQLGDAGAMDVLRAHDRIVREAIRRNGGSEVKHTGDGLMASFASVVGAIESGVEIQRLLLAAEDTGGIRVRIGMSAGEPVTEHDDLFGAVVQLAARICSRAAPGTVLVSSTVRELALGKGFDFGKSRRVSLKGFDEPVRVFEVLLDQSAVAQAAIAAQPGAAAPRSASDTSR
jgi:class 3 adenylate cyclase